MTAAVDSSSEDKKEMKVAFGSKKDVLVTELEAVPFSVPTIVSDVINSGLIMARCKNILTK